MEEQIPDEEKAGGVSDYTGVGGTMGEGESVSVEEAPGVVKKGPMYKWVDEKGVIRVTNDLGSVPPEYLDKIELDKGQ